MRLTPLKYPFTESRDWRMLVTSVIHQNVAMENSISKPHKDPKFSKKNSHLRRLKPKKWNSAELKHFEKK